jgi:hypothetical protein
LIEPVFMKSLLYIHSNFYRYIYIPTSDNKFIIKSFISKFERLYKKQNGVRGGVIGWDTVL